MAFSIGGRLIINKLSNEGNEANFSLRLISATKPHDPSGNGLVKLQNGGSLEGSITSMPATTLEEQYGYYVYFRWTNELGIPGAFQIWNHGQTEFFLMTLTIDPIPNLTTAPIYFVYPNYESRLPADQAFSVYVPRDDRFGSQKLNEFLQFFPKSQISFLKPFVKTQLVTTGEEEFKSFENVRDVLYESGFKFFVPKEVLDAMAARSPITPPEDGYVPLKFPIPGIIQANLDGWMTDEQFAREMFAGGNPVVIRLLQEFPIKSTLDPNVYGDHTCTITKQHLEKNLNGLTVEKAVERKRLFILDHHDSFMPYMRLINSETPSRAYGNRTVLFLQDNGTLKPLAIELSLPHPKGDQFGAVSKVFLPATQGVEASLWLLAKAYVTVTDTGLHQVASHWLNTHAVIEPIVIATHRHLSVLHPIHKLLHPHLRDTLFINAIGRQNLTNAFGIIEDTMLPGKFSMEMSSVIYKSWNFIDQALPNDLLKRGMAVKNPKAPYGLDLVIKDYPYAVDGLDIWDAINTWVRDYVSSYYDSDQPIQQDTELQSWWKEVVEVGHADLKNKPWWPKMQTREELIESCTIIIWTSSALHAAVNFGQYPFGGYILNRPTLSRRFIPEEGSEEYEELVRDPKQALLKTITPKYETLLALSIIEILSSHSSDEIYLGTRDNPNWTSDEKALVAFEKFGKRMGEIEQILIKRNKDGTLLNRVGPVDLPYTMLYPTSEPGVTGRGVPNSISI
ncbi:putative linoleate 9S-lipoxygenase 5 [Senna tora]|uniref:Lipoxygenase n=1 Tax=Senna tora TaxID=362788 RepID=A0A835CHN4_9FABA|nr:putative linoleate 9S-lipoxygenase 5 [Senna tora]